MSTSTFDRRSFGKLVGTLAAAGAVPLAISKTAWADSGSLTPSSGAVGAGIQSVLDEPAAIGFRAGVVTRLDVLEGDAGLTAIPQGDTAFHPWINRRESRLEDLRKLVCPAQGNQSWRDWTAGRVATLDGTLPDSLRFRFFTHMPLDVPGSDYATLLRQRIAEGSCNGIFLYGNPGTPMGPTAVMQGLVDSGPPVPIIMSPKNVSDAGQLAAWMNFWAAHPEWLPYVRVAFWQEFQGDFGGAGQPPVSDWQKSVITLADAADQIGVASMAHAETWNLHPIYKPCGGIPRLLEFLEPVIARIGGGISWSVFVFNQKQRAGNDFVQWMNEFMTTYFPYTSYGVSAYGDAVDPAVPAGDPIRVARAERVASTFRDLLASNATNGGYYALPIGPDATRNFWDDLVEAKVVEALAAGIS